MRAAVELDVTGAAGSPPIPASKMTLAAWKEAVVRAKEALDGAAAAATEVLKPVSERHTTGVERSLPAFISNAHTELEGLTKNLQAAIEENPALAENSTILERQANELHARASAAQANAEAARAQSARETDIVRRWPSDSLADRLTVIGTTLLGSGSVSWLLFRPAFGDWTALAPFVLWAVGILCLAAGLWRVARFTYRRRTYFDTRFSIDEAGKPLG